VLEATASPAQPRMPAELEVYSRERFDWVPFAPSRFDARSRLRFTFVPVRKLVLRLVLLRATRGFVGGPSNAVSLPRSQKYARGHWRRTRLLRVPRQPVPARDRFARSPRRILVSR
jgi:hypothetical protein